MNLGASVKTIQSKFDSHIQAWASHNFGIEDDIVETNWL